MRKLFIIVSCLCLIVGFSFPVKAISGNEIKNADLSLMTRDELYELSSRIDEEIRINHKTTSTLESKTLSVTKSYVESLLESRGATNVSWPWFDYSYYCDWDLYKLITSVDYKIDKQSVSAQICAYVYPEKDEHVLYYLSIGNEVLINRFSELPEKYDSLDLKSKYAKPNDAIGEPPSGDSVEPNEKTENSSTAIDGTPNSDIDDTTIDMNPEEMNTTIDLAAAEKALQDTTSEPVKIIAKRGDKGDEVRQLQQMLIGLGYLSGKADGDFGRKTEEAVKRYQADSAQSETGIVDELLYASLSDEFSSLPVPTPKPTPAPTAKPLPSFTASELYNIYSENKVAADKKYKGERIKVTGKVYSVTSGWFGTVNVSLEVSAYSFFNIDCSFSSEHEDDLVNLKKGNRVTIIGICDGMPLDISMSECELVK